LERYPEATLVEAELQTGRTHQVRVHFAAIGHPVVGDRTYGRGGAQRQALHASYLEFRHPVTGKRMLFRS
jgi:23S rRNA-/tRNA-specific pseudouridylate synthase